MKTCIILHNMIVDDERLTGVKNWEPEEGENEPARFIPVGMAYVIHYVTQRGIIRNAVQNAQLQADLVEHLWNRDGNQPLDV